MATIEIEVLEGERKAYILRVPDELVTKRTWTQEQLEELGTIGQWVAHGGGYRRLSDLLGHSADLVLRDMHPDDLVVEEIEASSEIEFVGIRDSDGNLLHFMTDSVADPEESTRLRQALAEALEWCKKDLEVMEDITPDEDMLRARIEVLSEALGIAPDVEAEEESSLNPLRQ